MAKYCMGKATMTIMGPNDAVCVVQALGEFSFSFLRFFILFS